MTEYTVKELKNKFLQFFKNKGHEIIKSSSVLPCNDPSLLFTNSGMVQFKNILLGKETHLKRACSIQRCIRAGGKHNDLDDVGKDTYHHTYFEMMGNWSFGDYGKKEAIDFAWDFLVDILKLDKDRLYVTYYKDMDTESCDLWSIKLPRDHIIAADKKDNFWEMGETGPCGPCTEIHYDRIGNRDASYLVNKDDPNVLEIWNLVFIEYNRTKEKLEPLEKRCIDTGIGFERLLSILNNVMSNYLTPCFTRIITRIENMTGFKYEDKFSTIDMAFRILSDHCRTISVCLFDGLEFSNEKQGYVMRRIIRRAIRYAHDVLGMKKGDLGVLIRELLIELYEEDSDLHLNILENKIANLNNTTSIQKIDSLINLVNNEENLFLITLKKGLERFEKMCSTTKTIGSEEIFRLYDTYGFPLDLVQLLAEEKNVKLDLSSYDKIKEEARNLSKKNTSEISEIMMKDVAFTDDSMKYTENDIKSNLQFLVYDGSIIKLSKVNLQNTNKEIGLVFDKTVFYSECGGQVGDTGVIIFTENDKEVGKFDVQSCKKVTGYVIHYGKLNGKLSNTAILKYDDRSDIQRNHTATHLLNYTLRKCVKTQQKGSLVDKSKFRLDFEGSKVDLAFIENNVNLLINEKLDVEARLISKNSIKDEESLIYMVNEEYPDTVRMIYVKDTNIKELCGGTHVKNTGEIYKMRILSEGSISNNIRRIVGITGEEVKKAEKRVIELEHLLDQEEVVNIDKEIPLFYRIRLEEKLNKNIEKKKLRKKENLEKNLEAFIWHLNVVIEHNRHLNTLDIKQINNYNLDLVNKRSRIAEGFTFLKFEIVNFEYKIIESEKKKEIFKNIYNFIKRINEEDDFVIWFKDKELVHGYLRHFDMKYVKNIIAEKCPDSFLLEKNGVLQFSIKPHKDDVVVSFKDLLITN